LKAGIDDNALCKAIEDAAKGLFTADLGGSLIKQRIARTGQGKSGGFRTIIVFRKHMRAIFVHGFAKNEKENIGREDLAALKKLASELLTYDEKAMERAVNAGILIEVSCAKKTVS
jgi:hypothetical protein